MPITRSLVKIATTAFIAIPTCAVYAQEWKVNLSPSATSGVYQSSTARERFQEVGAALNADYGDQGGLQLGASRTTVTMKSAPNTQQTNLLVSGHTHFKPQATPGRWSARLDLHRVTNNDQSNITDRVEVWAPQLGWQSADDLVYVDLGFARSRYGSDMTVNQITPTVRFLFNDSYDSIQLRSYQVSGLNPLLASGKSNTSAFEAKWTHFLKPGESALKPSSVSVGLMGGERVYGVDMDSQSVANLPDIQTGVANIGANWKLTPATNLFVLLGQNRFRSVALANDYELHVAHATLSLDF